MKKSLGIIGFPLGHSLSPAMHQGAIDHLGLNMTYEPWEISTEEVCNFFKNMRKKGSGIIGCSITVPHKETALKFMDEITEEGEKAGAINTVVNRDGLLVGHNTDGIGFLNALALDSGVSLVGKKLLILGAGGAARGISMAVAMYQPEKITIANRDMLRARELAADLQRQSVGHVESVSLYDENIPNIAANADVIVQTTTVGMSHGPDETGKSIPTFHISPSSIVYDLVYNPTVTPFMQMARQYTDRVYGGLSMLVHQGAIAFKLWTGVQAPTDIMFQIARNELEK